MNFFDSSNKPSDWPVNNREYMLERVYYAMEAFREDPGYKTKEVLISLISEHDLNQRSYLGQYRVTEFEVELVNVLYLMGSMHQINALKTYLYEIVGDTTRMQKMTSWSMQAAGVAESIEIKVYDEMLLFPLKLYHYAYQKFNFEKNKGFADQIIELVNQILGEDPSPQIVSTITHAYVSMLNDLSYMHGTKRENIWKFSREELARLFALEAKLICCNHQLPTVRPLKGVLMTQISNYILKSRNDYNEDYIYKYIAPNIAEMSLSNHQIWMQKTEFLNDEREQKVIPELFEDRSWIKMDWVKDIDFTETRTYYVSSFSKSANDEDMKSDYGSCIYGFKNDRIVEMLGPIVLHKFRRTDDADPSLPEVIFRPCVSQVLAFDVLYDKEQAKEELAFLFRVIDEFDMSNEEKKQFLQEILQYWILSVKDPKWAHERERRYIIFLYDGYDYKEIETDDRFLKVKTSIFLFPDFILGENPVKSQLKNHIDEKRGHLSVKDYLYCKDCLMRDYDEVLEKHTVCPICGSPNLEVVSIQD